LFVGSAGWGPGQLEGEIGERAWWVVEAASGEILTSDPSGLWRRVVHRQRQPVAWFADYPPSLLVN
jgi:putative transcriptional regulator